MNQTIVTVPSYIRPTYAYAAQPTVVTQPTNTVNTHAQPARIKQQPQLVGAVPANVGDGGPDMVASTGGGVVMANTSHVVTSLPPGQQLNLNPANADQRTAVDQSGQCDACHDTHSTHYSTIHWCCG